MCCGLLRFGVFYCGVVFCVGVGLWRVCACVCVLVCCFVVLLFCKFVVGYWVCYVMIVCVVVCGCALLYVWCVVVLLFCLCLVCCCVVCLYCLCLVCVMCCCVVCYCWGWFSFSCVGVVLCYRVMVCV